jgi:hypothetical protein
MKKGDFIGIGMEANLAEKAIFDQCTTPLSRIYSSAIFLSLAKPTSWPAVQA